MWAPREGFDEWYLKSCKCKNCGESGKHEKIDRSKEFDFELLFVCKCGWWTCLQANKEAVFTKILAEGMKNGSNQT